MAFSGITATEAQIDQKAGADVSASYTDTMKTQALLQAEAWLNLKTKRNWSDDFAGLDSDVQGIITAITASWVAQEAIAYDPSAFTPLRTAELKLDILADVIAKGLKELEEKEKAAFVRSV